MARESPSPRRRVRHRSSSSSTSTTSSSSSSSDSSRSRSRRRHTRGRRRSRTRSRSYRLSRSVSRGLYREQEEPVQQIKKIVQSQQEVILELLSEHKAEVEEKLQQRTRRFGSRQIEKQFQINSQYRELVSKTQHAITNDDIGKAKELLQLLSDQLEEHEQDLIIADSSPHGWLTVSKLRTTKELPKALRKRLAEVERDLNQQKQRKHGGPGKKFTRFPQQGSEGDHKRADKRSTPEEALFTASKQVRTGQCTNCHETGHFFRECPKFWTAVLKSRSAKAKEGQDD
jgi:hypothetical protein